MIYLSQKVAIIIPYFGKLPNYFELWLESVKRNANIDIFFFTNNFKLKNCPPNVHWVVTTFTEVKNRAQKIIEFPISMNTPYKLVDYKPLYGMMFYEYIKEYDWWGWGDIDTIWGRLDIIVNDQNLKKFDKILDLGHLTLMRNTCFMNNLWRKKVSGAWSYKDAFNSNLIFHFDEGGGMAFIAKKSGCRIYSEKPNSMNFADILPFQNEFKLAYKNDDASNIFTWNNGKLTGYQIKEDKIFSKEYAYIHLQKRKMNISISINDIRKGFLIVPNSFLPLINRKITKNDILNLKNVALYSRKSKKENKKNLISRIKHFIQVKIFKFQSKKNKIPLNGNEVYFEVEKPKF